LDIDKLFYVNPSQFTTKQLTVVSDNGTVENETNGELIILIHVLNGEGFRVLEESDDLIKINFKGKEGYIDRRYAKIFCGIENHK
jgi:hypothetical protein